MDIRMSITDWIAVYGAFLATFVFIRDYLRTRSKIKVIIVYGVDGIVVSVQNLSASTAHITNLSFLYPLKSASVGGYLKHVWKYRTIPRTLGWCHSSFTNLGINDGCPLQIESEKSHVIEIPERVLDKMFEDASSRTLKVVVQDGLWRHTYSSKFRYGS